MKKLLFLLVLICGFTATAAVAKEQLNIAEEFSDPDAINSWSYTKRMWPAAPVVEDGKLKLQFTGGKSNSNHLITYTLDKAYSVADENNIVMEMKVKFGENVCLASSFPTIVGGAYDGKIEAENDSCVYKLVDENNEKVTVGNIEANTEYLISVKINFITKSRNVYIKNLSTQEIQKAEDVKYANDVGSLRQIKILGYTQDTSVPANVEIDYLRIFRDEFEIMASSVKDGDENVLIDSQLTFTATKDIQPETIGVGMKTAQDAAFGVMLKSDEFVPYEVLLDEDMRTIRVSFPTGLRYGGKYKVTVPSTVKSSAGDAMAAMETVFYAEKPPRRCESISATDENGTLLDMDIITNIDKIKIISDIVNNSGRIDNIKLLAVLYNSSGDFVGLRIVPMTVELGKNTYTSEIDISGTQSDALSLKVFFIDSLKGFGTVY